MAVVEVNKDNFENEVLKSDKPVIADFNAEWCGPCKVLGPILNELSDERDDIKIVSVNIDDEDELADDFDITSIPCLVVFKNGEEVNRNVGLINKDQVIGLLGGD